MATSPGPGTTVPSYNLSQDDHTIQIRIHCPLAPPNSQPTVVSDGQVFGFTCPKMGRDPYFLPLFLPMPVHSPVLHRDPATSALIVTLRKTQPGVHIHDLSLLQPSIHPDIPFGSDFLDGSGAGTPISPFETHDPQQGYVQASDVAHLVSGEQAAAFDTQSSSARSLGAPATSAEHATEDSDVRQAADELIALGIKNENERRRAEGQPPLIIAGEDSSAADRTTSNIHSTTDYHSSLSHVKHSSEASTTSSSSHNTALAEMDMLPSTSGAHSVGRDALSSASSAVAATPSPGKLYSYGFRGACTGAFLPNPADPLGTSSPSISSSTLSSALEGGSNIASAAGTASPSYVRSRVHELQQDVRKMAWSKRRKIAKLREEEKWDEGRYLDGYVDEFGEIGEILAWEPAKPLEPSAAALALASASTASQQSALDTDEPVPVSPTIATAPSALPAPQNKTSREAHLAALQFLFAYAYDWRTTQGEHNVESDWTFSVLCRSLVAQCAIEPASPPAPTASHALPPRATSPSGSIASGVFSMGMSLGLGGPGASSSSVADLAGGGPRAVSPVSNLSANGGGNGAGGPAAHQNLDGAITAAAHMGAGTPTLRSTSPDSNPTLAGVAGSPHGAIPMTIAGSVASMGGPQTFRRPGSSDAIGSPPPSAVGVLSSPAMSSSLSGSLAAPRRASGLSASGMGSVDYNGHVGSGTGGVAGSAAGSRGKIPAMRDEPELDTPLTILRASYRRALTLPLHRSWALCDKVRDDVLSIFRAGLSEVLKALRVVEERLVEAEDVVMHRYAEVWVTPVREWLENHGSDHSLALLAAEIVALSSELTRDFVGGEVWDLELLEAAAADALEEGQGGYS
ncbi:hypothetical protein OC846_000161 [Tilletia horrida]|uniref:Shq1 protein domain-containing protein n=1 Tax=Tilletia horrida TaxID=155126 RepID=A0AAN6H1A3_9BASI|nr:hypothetical protein OC846_000161 [Tilletia horrida]KAK0570088.1 hypothetical protein OC861_000230 [Tilletia horrida]